MVDIGKKNVWKKCYRTIVDYDGISWLNEKHIEEWLDHNNFREITTKYHSDHRISRHELYNKSKKECNRNFVGKKLAIRVILDYRLTS